MGAGGGQRSGTLVSREFSHGWSLSVIIWLEGGTGFAVQMYGFVSWFIVLRAAWWRKVTPIQVIRCCPLWSGHTVSELFGEIPKRTCAACLWQITGL